MVNQNSHEEVNHNHLRKWIDIPSYFKKNLFLKEKVFQSDEDKEEGNNNETEVFIDENQTVSTKMVVSEEENYELSLVQDGDSNNRKEEFERF